jgi:hypothetical protein
MPLGTATTEGSSGENVNHFGGVRMRVVGSGNLLMSFYSLDDVRSQTLVPFSLSSSTRFEPFRLANFTEQRASLEIKTTVINEWFRINRVIIFARPVAVEYPA